MIVVLLGDEEKSKIFSSYLQTSYSIRKTNQPEGSTKMERPYSFRPFREVDYESTINGIFTALTGTPLTELNNPELEEKFVIGTKDTYKSFKEKIKQFIPQILPPFLSVIKKCNKKDNSVVIGFSEEDVERWRENPNILFFNITEDTLEERERLVSEVLLWENNLK